MGKKKQKTIIILSGGMDSSTLLHKLHGEGHELEALSFFYGQKHKKELKFAKRNASALMISHRIVSVDNIFTNHLTGDSSLLRGDIEVPEGHYEDETMKSTVVPNRNMIFLSIAIARAIAIGAQNIAYAAHAGDHAIYPDCRRDFVDKIAALAQVCDYNPITIMAPFVHMSKADIVKLGVQLDVPYDLTWSCYVGGQKHCGKCGTCVERREAFELAGVPDPTEYEEA